MTSNTTRRSHHPSTSPVFGFGMARANIGRTIDQNRRPQANAISVELLSLIFHFAKSGCGHEDDPIQVYDQNLFLVRLSAVCHRWRFAAIGDGTLWRNISFSPSRSSTIGCAAEFLRRSRRASLALMMWNPDSSNIPVATKNPEITHILNHLERSISRITELVAINPPEAVIEMLTQPATSLVRLSIQTTKPTAVPSLFGGVMPKLQDLTISNPVGWKLRLFQNLGTVHLLGTPSKRWRLSGLLDCIDASTVIKELHLSCFDNFEPETSAESRRMVSLPSLHILRLTLCDSALIIDRLEIPPSATLSIYGSCGHSEDILACLPGSSRFLRMLKGTRFLTVVLDVERQIFEVDIMGPEGIHLTVGTVPLQGALDRKWVLRSMAAIVRLAPISEVKWLTVVVDEFCMPWNVWLSKFDKVSTLEVRCPDPAELLGALAARIGETERIVCPALRSLSVECGECPTVDSSLLRKCLEIRALAGSVVSALNLNDSQWTTIPQTELDAWERLICHTRLDVTTGSFTRREDLLLGL